LKKGRSCTVQFVGKTGSTVPEPLQRGFVQGLHLFWHGDLYSWPLYKADKRNVQNLPLVGSILGGWNSKPIQLPTSLSYLHISTLPQPILDSLFECLWTILQPTDPLLLAPLTKASVLELDILPSTIQVRAIWASAPHPDGWRLEIRSVPGTKTEIGIFQEESGGDKDEFGIGGVRAILGKDREFSPTLFTFPHRDHVLSSARVISHLEPVYGSHPNIRTLLPASVLVPPVNDTLDHETCRLRSLYTLSKEVFVDKYQLSQLAQFHSGGIADVRGVWGEMDLEDPTYKTEGWGSVVLLDVAIPQEEGELVLELPVHLRYLEPSNVGAYEALTLLPPRVFWSCQNSDEGTPPSWMSLLIRIQISQSRRLGRRAHLCFTLFSLWTPSSITHQIMQCPGGR
jgi:PIG-X / PBN1